MPDQFKKDNYVGPSTPFKEPPIPRGWQGNGGQKEDNRQRVLQFLKGNGYINITLAKSKLKIHDPQPYIFELRLDGHKIDWDLEAKRYEYKGMKPRKKI